MYSGLLLAPGAIADANPMDLSGLGNYGVLGVFAALLIWFARSAHQRERDRADKDRADRDRMEAENRNLHMMILEKVIPVLSDATQVAQQCARMLGDLQRDLQRDQRRDQRRDRGGET